MNESPPRRQKRNKNWCKPCTKTCNKTWKCVIRIVARRNGRNRQVSDGVHKSITPEWRVIISFSFFSFFFFRWWWLWWERLCEDLRLLQRTGVVQYFDLSVVVICVWPEGEEGVDAQTEVKKDPVKIIFQVVQPMCAWRLEQKYISIFLTVPLSNYSIYI